MGMSETASTIGPSGLVPIFTDQSQPLINAHQLFSAISLIPSD
jgi:hypothetical protein